MVKALLLHPPTTRAMKGTFRQDGQYKDTGWQLLKTSTCLGFSCLANWATTKIIQKN